jgi:hypothetical protein
MSGAIPPLPHYAFMAWCSVKAQGQFFLYLCLRSLNINYRDIEMILPAVLYGSKSRHILRVGYLVTKRTEEYLGLRNRNQ